MSRKDLEQILSPVRTIRMIEQECAGGQALVPHFSNKEAAAMCAGAWLTHVVITCLLI